MKLKSLVKNAIYQSGIYNIRCAVKTSRNKRLLILMYHDFEEGINLPRNNNIVFQKPTRDDFEAHLKAIKNQFRAISVEEAMKEIRYGGGLRENSVAITFDDGYASAYRIAYPLLKKYGLSATVYLPTDWINGKITLWWENLAELINEFDVNNIDIKRFEKVLIRLAVSLPDNLTNQRETRELLLQDVSFALMKRSDQDKIRIILELTSILFGAASKIHADVKPLTWEQIKEMDESGIKFGAHTQSHPNLSFVDLKVAEEEIAGSKQEIENHLGHNITGFAYPYGYDINGYGRFSPILEECKFDYACTSWWGSNVNRTNPYLLYRGAISPIDSPSLLGRELYIGLLQEQLANIL
ncbi:MAG TPA: hypothetical protein DEO84_02200 [candidate division Zixibacteria bacterium]|jgi:peptidoglycan/xylan/chitin deacetylase (PgdA/CDA1 family)|nr:hypothetical protein [candidate division Zixibacteria bacterium]HBZ00109.1 hypothetical protein [candidate division Zixibacteria bacterium]